MAQARDLRAHLAQVEVDLFPVAGANSFSESDSAVGGEEGLKSEAIGKVRPLTAEQQAYAKQNARLCDMMQKVVEDTSDLLKMLRHAQAGRKGALQLCEHRRHLWSHRPVETADAVLERASSLPMPGHSFGLPSPRSEDCLQEALGSELMTLRTSMADLAEHIKVLERLQSEAKSLRTKLLTLRQQRLGLLAPPLSKSANNSANNTISSVVSMTILIDPKEEGCHMRRAPDLQQEAWYAMWQSESTTARTEAECAKANAATLQKIELQMSNTADEKQKLEHAYREVDKVVVAGQKQLLRSEQRLKAAERQLKARKRSGDAVPMSPAAADLVKTTEAKVEKLSRVRTQLAKKLQHAAAVWKVVCQIKKCSVVLVSPEKTVKPLSIRGKKLKVAPATPTLEKSGSASTLEAWYAMWQSESTIARSESSVLATSTSNIFSEATADGSSTFGSPVRGSAALRAIRTRSIGIMAPEDERASVSGGPTPHGSSLVGSPVRGGAASAGLVGVSPAEDDDKATQGPAVPAPPPEASEAAVCGADAPAQASAAAALEADAAAPADASGAAIRSEIAAGPTPEPPAARSKKAWQGDTEAPQHSGHWTSERAWKSM